MSSQVSTGISDNLWRLYTIPVFSRSLRLAIPNVGVCNEYWRWFQQLLGKKWRVLRNSKPCDQDCGHTEVS